jgi:hypothetical protein
MKYEGRYFYSPQEQGPAHLLFANSSFIIHTSYLPVWGARLTLLAGRPPGVIPAASGRIYHQGAKTPREDSQGGRGGKSGVRR